jgi:hypothetical protein
MRVRGQKGKGARKENAGNNAGGGGAAILERWATAHGTPRRVLKRCRIILRKTGGMDDGMTAAELGLGLGMEWVDNWH